MTDTILNYANEIFVAVLVPLVAYLATLARSYVKAKVAALDSFMDDEARARLEAAFDNAISALEQAGTSADIHDVIRYVERFNPGDLDRFGLKGDKLLTRVRAAIDARKGA